MTAWYQEVFVNLETNLQSLLLMVGTTVMLWILSREMHRVFARLRLVQRLPSAFVDVLESISHYTIWILLFLALILVASFPLGLHAIAFAAIPHFLTVGIAFIVMWCSLNALTAVFQWVRAQKRVSLEVIGSIEVLVKYSTIVLGSFFLFIYALAGLGYAEIIGALITTWLSTNVNRVVLVVVCLILLRITTRFITSFFQDLTNKMTFQPRVADIGSMATRSLLYLVVGLIVLSSLLQIIGAPELIPLLTSVFSVLFGVGFSFAAAGAIGNFVAGLVLTSWKPYQPGDRVEIGSGVYGDIAEFDILFTKIKTIKNEIISVPNLSVLGNKIMNYSALTRCIVHSRITVGYEVPRHTVEDLLLAAVSRTDGLIDDPAPYVLIPELATFYVVYEINAYTDAPNQLVTIYSNLHKNILDLFNEAKINLVSPSFHVIKAEHPAALPPSR